MDWKRVLRIAVCLVLVCTLVIGISPLRADAVALELSAVLASLNDMACAGIILYTIFFSAGEIFTPPDDVQSLEQAGEALTHWVVENMYFPSSGDSTDDDDEDPEDPTPADVAAKAAKEAAKLGGLVREQVSQKWGTGDRIAVNLGAYFLGAATQFVSECIQNGYFEREVETPAATGWSYYGDYYLPDIPLSDSYSYYSLSLNAQGNCYMVLAADVPFAYDLNKSQLKAISPTSYSYIYISFDAVEHWDPYTDSWPSYSSMSAATGKYLLTCQFPFWSNFDVTSYYEPGIVVCAGSDPSTSSVQKEAVEPIATVGPIVEGIIAGGLTAADIPIPETVDLSSIFAGAEVSGVNAVLSNMQSSAAGLASGAIALDDFRQSITYVSDGSDEDDPGEVDPGDDPTDPTEDPGPTEGVDDPDDPGGDSETIPSDSTFADFPVLNFFAKLGELLQNISDGNLLGIKNLLDPWLQDIRGDLSGVRDDLSGIDSSIQDGFQDVIDANEQQSQLNQEVQQEQNNIISQGFASVAGMVSSGISAAFVPSEGFFDQKVDDLCDEYAFAASIADTAKDMKSFLTNLGSVPPVIRINLGAATGKYHYGGDMVLVDFSFYEPYKPQMDAILSAFLWLWFCWRVILSLPGIISGASGVIGAFAPSDAGSRGYIEMPHASSGQSDSPRSYIRGWGSPGSTSHYNAWRDKMAREDKDKF